jgi:predicted helicase
MQHFIKGDNIGFAGIRINKEKDEVGYSGVFLTKNIAEARLSDRFITSVFPLYLYSENFGKEERTPNLNMEIVKKIEEELKLAFVPEENVVVDLSEGYDGTFTPIDLFDYIYAILHSPNYREKYKEFLKIDFPRVPYPAHQKTFWNLVDLGRKIREIHLLESPVVENYITQYPIDGNNEVTKPRFVIANEVKQSNEQTASFLAVTPFPDRC